jgi:hypothetical protein
LKKNKSDTEEREGVKELYKENKYKLLVYRETELRGDTAAPH